MNSLCIIPCGKKKVWDKFPDAGPTVAREVYIGPFAKKCREYAQKFFPDCWVILSAKHGFLFPDDIVPGPYEVSFNKKNTNPIGVRELGRQAAEKEMHRYEQIVVLGGKPYVLIATQIFPEKTIEAPISGLSGLGEIMSRIKKAIAQNNKLS